MHSISRLVSIVAGAVALTGSVFSLAQAADWPQKPIKVIVPFKAGGTTDQVARAYASTIENKKLLPQPLVILDIGGHFSIGARQAMEAKPDGYTFLLIHMALMGGQAMGQMNFGYRDFAPVAATGQFCLLPEVRKDSGITSLEQLLDKAKEKPGTLLFGVNIGALNHLAAVQLETFEPGARFRFVQIGGGTANFTALTGGQTQATFNSTAEVMNFTRLPNEKPDPNSQIRPLAYSGAERFPSLPEIPSYKELGYDATFCVDNWWFAPKGTPSAAIDGLANALKQAGETTKLKDFDKKQGFVHLFITGNALKQNLDETWAKVQPLAEKAKAEAKAN